LRLTKTIRAFLRTSSYQVGGMVAIWLNPVVDKIMASWLGEGSVSVLHYADRLYIIPIAFICTGLMATTISHWSSRYYELGQTRLGEDIKRAVKIVGTVTVLITAFLLLFHGSIVRVAYGRGAFEPSQLPAVSRTWVCYLIGLVPYVIARIYFQAHLVLKNTRFLMLYAFGFNLANILLNYLLMKKYGVAGIALATSVCSLLAAFWLGRFLFAQLKTESDPGPPVGQAVEEK